MCQTDCVFTISRLTSYSREYVKHTTEPLQVLDIFDAFLYFCRIEKCTQRRHKRVASVGLDTF